MCKHLIPYDTFQHIESPSCNCNPQVVVSEGEEQYIHNIMSNNMSIAGNLNIDWYSNNTIKGEE